MIKYLIFYYILSAIVTFLIVLKIDAHKAKSIRINIISSVIVALTLGWLVLPYKIIRTLLYTLAKLIAKLLNYLNK